MVPFVQTFVPMSKDLEQWLRTGIGVDGHRIVQIYNGVDAKKFCPASGSRSAGQYSEISDKETIVVGSVGRMDHVKDQLTLVRAFLRLLEIVPWGRHRLRLVHIGDGALMAKAKALIREADAEELAWFPGTRDDVPALLREFDIFVLPSLGEGISNTILEAMATGLPVVATRVGGNSELVAENETGTLVQAADVEAMTRALHDYVLDPDLRIRHGMEGRSRVEKNFSIQRMVQQYMDVYESLLERRGDRSVRRSEIEQPGQTS
jgi:sugar transferase (PEP-CTERM/EpsH1 system associated)